MADWYVYHGGSGTGTTWATAYTTLNAAMTAKAAGDRFFVAHDHVQTQASALTIIGNGTEASPQRVYCVNRAGSVPPVSADLRTTAQISTTGAFTITLGTASVAEVYGIIFSAGSSTNSASILIGSVTARAWRMVRCHFKLANTNTASRITPYGGTARTILEDCTVEFGATGQAMSVGSGHVIIRGPSSTSFIVGTPPTTLLGPVGAISIFFEGVDLSAMTGTMIGTSTAGYRVIMKDCKLGSAAVTSGGGTVLGGTESSIVRCDSADTNYRLEKRNFAGHMTTETTIVRTGGATDGTTPIAWKIAHGSTLYLFESPPIQMWNDTTGSAKTVTIEGIWGEGATPLANEIWIDVMYLGTSGTGKTSRITSEVPWAMTASNLPAGSGTWGGSTTKFKMAVTFTPQEKGPITVYVRTRKNGYTFYIDPKPVIT